MMSYKSKMVFAISLLLLICCIGITSAAIATAPVKIWQETGGAGGGNVYYGGGVFNGVFYTGQIDWGARSYSSFQTAGTALLNGIHWVDGGNAGERSSCKSSVPVGSYIFYTWQDGGVFRADNDWTSNLVKPFVGSVQESLATDGTNIFSNDDGVKNTLHKWVVNNSAASFTLNDAGGWPVVVTGATRFRGVSYYNGKVYVADYSGTGIYEIDATTGSFSQIATLPAANSAYQAVRYGDQLFVVGLDDYLRIYNYSAGSWSAGDAFDLGLSDLYGLGVKGNGTKATGFWVTSVGTQVSYFALEAYTASGTIALGDFSASPAGQQVVFEIQDSDGLIRTYEATLDENGAFEIPNVEPGDYTVAIKASHWLRKVISPLTMPSNDQYFGTIDLVNGDCDGDNEVTSTDLSVVLSAMDSLEGDPTWDPTADLDGDLEITSTDLSIVLANMDMLGD